ncbi:MAG: hypothetical protein VX038_05170 [Verrucomicrobiota bacterium]|nr:hypothetical protein [Verrucomicrobiota bacterium]
MNEFESIEKELKSLTPKHPSPQLSDRIEQGLGDAGNLAMRRLPEEIKFSSAPVKSNRFFFPWFGFGIAASLMITFLSVYFWGNSGNEQFAPLSPNSTAPQVSLDEDPESPIHGVSVAELEAQSGMPVGGWLPTFQERLLDRIDEGVISRPGRLPARQVRMHYIDEILWQHPATNKRILSTQPRQEIILIDLDLY